MPVTIAHDVAQRAAPALTTKTREAFDAGRSVYGEPRPNGADGKPLTLRKSGSVSRDLRFVANGSIVRCVLGPDYARYLIGKYGVLPNGALPADWSRRLHELVKATKPP